MLRALHFFFFFNLNLDHNLDHTLMGLDPLSFKN